MRRAGGAIFKENIRKITSSEELAQNPLYKRALTAFQARQRPHKQTTEKEPNNGSSWRQYFGAKELQDVWLLLEDKETSPGAAYARFLQGHLTLKKVARTVCYARTQGEEETEKYAELVGYVDR